MIYTAILKFILGLFVTTGFGGTKVFNFKNIIIAVLAIAAIGFFGFNKYNSWQNEKNKNKVAVLQQTVQIQAKEIKNNVLMDEVKDKAVTSNAKVKDKIVEEAKTKELDRAAKIASIKKRHQDKLLEAKKLQAKTITTKDASHLTITSVKTPTEEDLITAELKKKEIEEISKVQIDSIWDNYCTTDKSTNAQQNCKKELSI